MANMFTEHPNSVGETYLQHMKKASSFSLKLLSLSICCFIHGVIPPLFETTASDEIECMNKKLQKRRGKALGRD